MKEGTTELPIAAMLEFVVHRPYVKSEFRGVGDGLYRWLLLVARVQYSRTSNIGILTAYRISAQKISTAYHESIRISKAYQHRVSAQNINTPYKYNKYSTTASLPLKSTTNLRHPLQTPHIFDKPDQAMDLASFIHALAQWSRSTIT